MAEAFASGSKVNYSRLAVITGLTRKDVSALVGQIQGSRSQPSKASREQRALRVIRGWRMDPRFHDERGRPAELPLRRGRRNFAVLVKAYARDVTPMSVLTELERLRMVSKTPSKNALRLLPRRDYLQSDAGHMTELARVLGDFVRTVGQKPASGTPPVFFSFRDAALSLQDQAARFERVFSHRAAALLDGFDQWMATQSGKRGRSNRRGVSQARVGVGVYLVNDLRPDPAAVKKRLGTSRKA